MALFTSCSFQYREYELPLMCDPTRPVERNSGFSTFVNSPLFENAHLPGSDPCKPEQVHCLPLRYLPCAVSKHTLAASCFTKSAPITPAWPMPEPPPGPRVLPLSPAIR